MKADYSERAGRTLQGLPPSVRRALFKQVRFPERNLRHPSLRAKKYDVLGDRPGFRDGLPVLSHASNVESDCLADQLRGLGERRSRRHAAGKIRDVCAVTGFGLFEKNGVFHFSPACLRILLMAARLRPQTPIVNFSPAQAGRSSSACTGCRSMARRM
jgi:hypothetical protein